MTDQIRIELDQVKKDIIEVKSENKYILQILEKISNTLEEYKKIQISLATLVQQMENSQTRIDHLSTKVKAIKEISLANCPIHQEKMNRLDEKITELENDQCVLEEELESKIKFRDKILITITTSIILQIISFILYKVFSTGGN